MVVQLTMSMVRPKKYMNLRGNKCTIEKGKLSSTPPTYPPTNVRVSMQHNITMTAVTKLLIMIAVTHKIHPAAVPICENISLAIMASVSHPPYFLNKMFDLSLDRAIIFSDTSLYSNN